MASVEPATRNRYSADRQVEIIPHQSGDNDQAGICLVKMAKIGKNQQARVWNIRLYWLL
jgi:hypothetical protein